jgi:hypothetical protein
MGTVLEAVEAVRTVTPEERAASRDAYIRSFERAFLDWSGIAKVCIDMKRDRDWELLGFRSFGAWLTDAAPCSRSYIYTAIDLYHKLAADIPAEELSAMPMGSAQLLTGVSTATRRDPKAKSAAKKGKRQLRKTMATDFPHEHIDASTTLDIPQGLMDVLEEGVDVYTTLSREPITLLPFMEFLVSDWLASECQDEQGRPTGLSMREMAEKVKAAK